ncbi:hypothetical protein BRIN106911_21340 [Brevibacillus invocatus]
MTPKSDFGGLVDTNETHASSFFPILSLLLYPYTNSFRSVSLMPFRSSLR